MTQKNPVTGDDITTNTWDGENRLVQVEHPSGDVTTYACNGDGLRVVQDDGVAETRFVYDGNNVVLELDDVGTVEAEFTYIPQAYAQVISQLRSGDSSFYQFDGTSNVRQLTDSSQVVTDDYAFEAWGVLISSTGSTANSQFWKGQFLAYRKDPDAGPEDQYATYHRNYNPKTGVFTSADPAKDDLNLYRYVKNNPVNRTDPSGLEEVDPRDIELALKYAREIKYALPYIGKSHNSTTVEVRNRGAQLVSLFEPEYQNVLSADPDVVYGLIRFYEKHERTILDAAGTRDQYQDREQEHIAHAIELQEEHEQSNAEGIAKAEFRHLGLDGRIGWMLGKALENGLFDKFGPAVKQQISEFANPKTLATFVAAFSATFLAGAALGPKGAAVVTLIITAMGLLGSIKDILVLADLFLRIRDASTYVELEKMVPELVNVIAKLAIDGALTILLRKVSKAGGKKGQEYEIDTDPSRANMGLPLKRKQDSPNSSTTNAADDIVAPSNLPDGVGPDWKTDWTPPKNWNGPVNHGEWAGPRGNGSWIDDRPEVIRVVGVDPATGKANPIVFYKGEARFSKYAQETFDVKGLVGTKVDSNADMAKILDEIARRKDLPSRAAARRWLANADDGFAGKGLAPHHAGGDKIELVPSAVHKVQHTDITN